SRWPQTHADAPRPLPAVRRSPPRAGRRCRGQPATWTTLLSWFTWGGSSCSPTRTGYDHGRRGLRDHCACLCRRTVSSTRVYLSGATPGPDRTAVSRWALQRWPPSRDTRSPVAPERAATHNTPAHRYARRRYAVERLRFRARKKGEAAEARTSVHGPSAPLPLPTQRCP